MNPTPNYTLKQWDASDRVLRTEFNDNFEKIDTILGQKVDIQIGTYTGNGEASQFIALEGTPQAVFVCPADGAICDLYGTDYLWGGLALKQAPAFRNTQDIIRIETGGFSVYYSVLLSQEHILTNQANKVFHFVAFFSAS